MARGPDLVGESSWIVRDKVTSQADHKRGKRVEVVRARIIYIETNVVL